MYIYDKSGAEVHQLRNHVDPTQLEFLRYHFLLASVGKTGYLKYQDTSTGSVVAEHRTGLGACDVMAQNPQTAILSLGHTNGTVTFWSPSSPQPHAKLLAHRGNLKSLAVDKQQGHYLATAGLDSKVKIWDMRMWEVVNEWTERKPAQSLDWSQKGLLSVGWGNHVSVSAVRATKPSRPFELTQATMLFVCSAVQQFIQHPPSRPLHDPALPVQTCSRRSVLSL